MHTKTFGNDLGSTGRDIIRILLCNTRSKRGYDKVCREHKRTTV